MKNPSMLKIKIAVHGQMFEFEGAEFDGAWDATLLVDALDRWFEAIKPSDAGATQKLDQILAQGRSIMAKQDELLAELVAANDATNEIASDLDALLARLDGGLSPAEADAVKAEISKLKDRLTGVAAKYTA